MNFRKVREFLGGLNQASPSPAEEARDLSVSIQTARSEERQIAQNEKSREDRYLRCRSHVLSRIEQAAVGEQPFYHAFIEEVFPADFYQEIRAHMLKFKHDGSVQDRHQDNPAFLTKRYNLVESTDEVVACIRGIFSDPEVKLALLKKFFMAPSQELVDALNIHTEFEYTFTQGGRFQNIHIDIPPKFLSFVFYIPEHPVAPEEEERNATILYDKSLKPHYRARFRANSVCVFAPHFHSYHGFASTIDRDVLVMFYVHAASMEKYFRARQQKTEEAPWNALCDAIEDKLRAYPLKEYEGGEERLLAERSGCLVNAPLGRVLV